MTSTNCYFKSGEKFVPSNESEFELHHRLPAGKYIIQENPQTEDLFFVRVESDYDFGVLYGNTKRYASRIMQTFQDRPASTGVGLTGEKGSGKTMLARLLSFECEQIDMPTLVINQPWTGDKFNKLIQDIKQPCMILFDEFEKVYHKKEDQEAVLTLLDGVFPTKKLFVITCNDASKLDTHMRNRPGRIYYLIEHGGLNADEITGYCNDKLKAKEHIPEIVKISQLFGKFNFDMMKAMVEEMNRFNEDPHEVMELLNARPSSDNEGVYDVDMRVQGKATESTWPRSLTQNPLSLERIAFSFSMKDDDAWDDDTTMTYFQSDLVHVDLNAGIFRYVNQSGGEVVLSRQNGKSGDLRKVVSLL